MRKKLSLILLCLLLLFAEVYLLFVPQYWLCLSHASGRDGFLVPLGQGVVLSYIHSLERTPVEDVFILQGDRIWLYEERVKSHNAGLPTFDQYPGSMIKTKDWLIFRGGRRHWPYVQCRVGNDSIGENILTIGSKRYELYNTYRGESIRLYVLMRPLL